MILHYYCGIELRFTLKYDTIRHNFIANDMSDAVLHHFCLDHSDIMNIWTLHDSHYHALPHL